jgi:hypothetical protein
LTNFYLGLARGPIDHQSSSVINAIAHDAIEMGSSVVLHTAIITGELLPRVLESPSPAIDDSIYGIAVGGDTDGIYGDGSTAGGDSTKATLGAGEGVVVVTQGRCLARVNGDGTAIAIGDPLAASTVAGVLVASVTTSQTIARALQTSTGTADIIAVDIQREGIF